GAGGALHDQAIAVVDDAGVAARFPAQRNAFATQREAVGLPRNQRADARIPEAGELFQQPVAVFVDEALAGDEAGARWQGKPGAAIAHAQADAARARVAHALDLDAGAVVQFELDHVAFDPARGR